MIPIAYGLLALALGGGLGGTAILDPEKVKKVGMTAGDWTRGGAGIALKSTKGFFSGVGEGLFPKKLQTTNSRNETWEFLKDPVGYTKTGVGTFVDTQKTDVEKYFDEQAKRLKEGAASYFDAFTNKIPTEMPEQWIKVELPEFKIPSGIIQIGALPDISMAADILGGIETPDLSFRNEEGDFNPLILAALAIGGFYLVKKVA